MSAFLTPLSMTALTHPKTGLPLLTRQGRQLYRIDQDLVYVSDIAGKITVPAGFVTDLASIPRLPLIYLLLNGIADEPGVVHDYLYSTGKVSRAMADQVLREACILTGVPAWKANLIYAGVRVGGASHYAQA